MTAGYSWWLQIARYGPIYVCSGSPACTFTKRIGVTQSKRNDNGLRSGRTSAGGAFQDEGEPKPVDSPGNSEGCQLRLRSGVEGVEQESPPDDRRRPKILSTIRSERTQGLPAPWTRPLDRDSQLRIRSDSDLPQLYAAALAALIDEIKTTGLGQKRYELEKGIRSEENASGILYGFLFDDAADLFEDAKVEVELPGRRVAASIVSIASGRIWLLTNEDLGAILHRAVIVVDATVLLEALREKIEQAGRGSCP